MKCETCGVKIRSEWKDKCEICGRPIPKVEKPKEE